MNASTLDNLNMKTISILPRNSWRSKIQNNAGKTTEWTERFMQWTD